jgi:hypothetical protein
MFLVLMAVGLAGLTVMALPALGGAKHAHSGGAHPGGAHPGGAHHGGALALQKLAVPFKGRSTALRARGPHAAGHGRVADSLGLQYLRLLPSPRMIFSLLALYGASGNVLAHVEPHHPFAVALMALVPALVVERLALTPLWNLAFRFQAVPSSPLDALVLEEASAVTPFRNGRGLVSVVRDGRLVQFSARLVEPERATSVRVGDRLRIEDVDSDLERLTVSIAERKVS